MRYKAIFSALFSLWVGTANANWAKINEVDYTWGAFNIYHISLFTETGKYTEGTRPLMLSLVYKKPWEGRDFAVSLARTWKNLNIDLPEKELNEVITRLRKNFPDIKPGDTLHYIALENRGYFILNDKVLPEIFSKPFNDAIVAIWLDPKIELSHQLLDPTYTVDTNTAQPNTSAENPIEKYSVDPHIPLLDEIKAEMAEKAASATSATKATEQKSAVSQEISKEVPSNNKPEGTNLPQQIPVTTNNAEKEKNAETETNSPKTAEITVAEDKKLEVKKVEDKKPETKQTETQQKPAQPENPEIFISPIYDDLLMLTKYYT